MANFDEMSFAVNELSGGKNVVIMDDLGLPSIYVVIPKGNNGNVISGGSASVVHPAFIVDGVEKGCFYYSKYQNVVFNNRAYSLSRRDPAVSMNHDTAKKYCTNKGKGFHLSTMAEWAYLALWSRKNGTMPHGNSNYGCDEAYGFERGVETCKDSGKTARCLTGSGPVTWAHDHTNAGIMDMKGNVWEWQDGLRLNNGEINIVANNNAALGEDCDTSANSTLWKAIMPDGSLVAPGTTGTLKYSQSGNSIVTSNSAATGGGSGGFADMGLGSGVSIPEIAKALILYPDEPKGDYAGDYHWWNIEGERLPICGGTWYDGANAGVFGLDLTNPRSTAGWILGFRSAFVDL